MVSSPLLDKRHQFIACEDLFRGTIDGASVYPREVLKEAPKHNAAAVILAHNHPSGVAEPSQADLDITKQLKKVLDPTAPAKQPLPATTCRQSPD